MKKLFLATTALIALAAGPAHADPISAAVAWVGSTMAAGGIAGFAVTTALSMSLSAIGTALFGPKTAAGSVNVSFQVEMGDDLPLSFTVGNYATAGKRKYIGSWGKNTRFITEVIEYSALPQGLAGLWVNDERGQFASGQRAWIGGADPSDDTSWTEGPSVPSGSIDIGQPLTNFGDDGNRIVVKVVDGTQTAADPFLLRVFGSDPDYPWTADHIGRGKSYVIVTTRYDSESLTQYPTLLWEPAPLPVYDWRQDSTNGGSGAQRWGNRSTYQPSLNPAVLAYNIARGIHWGDEWVFGGKNLAAWRLPIAEWTAAANACDQTVTLANGSTQPRYRAGIEIKVDMEPASVLEELGKAANMKFAEVGGRLKPVVDLPGAAVLHFTDDDILITEGQSFSPFYPVSETFNAVSATYPEPGEKWASKDAPEYVDAAATADDNGQYLPTSMQYGAVPYGEQVQRLMRSQMRDFRRMRRHQFYLPPDAYALEPGIDMISWTSDRNGYVNKLFMVESVNKTPGMNVLVSLREVDPSDYDWSSNFEQPVIIVPPVNPRPFVQPADGFAVAPALIEDATTKGRRPAILATYTGDEAGVREIRMQARLAGGTEIVIDTLRPWNDAQRWHLQNVLPATAYEVRAQLISELTPQRAWSPWHPVTTPDVGLTWEDFEQQLRDDLNAEFEKADQAARDAIAADEKAQEVRNDHDSLVEGFVGKLTDLSAADQGIQQRIDLIEMAVSNSSYIRKTDGDGPDVGQWTALAGAATPVSSTSVPPGQTGRSIQVAAPGAFEGPTYTGASLNGSTFRLRGWIFVSSGATARAAIVGPAGGTLAQSAPISGGWQQVDIRFEVGVETGEWAPAFLVSSGGTMRFWRVRLEDYSAAASLEASIGLNAQAIIDETTARAAQVGTLTARADSLAARIFPSDMRNQAEYWTNSPGLAPESTAGMADGVTFGTDAAAGAYVRIPAGHASNIHVLSKAVTEYAASKKIRVTVKLRTIGGPTAKLRTLFSTLRADWSVSRFIGNAQGQQLATTAGGTWQTVSVDYTLPAALADEVWLRIGVYSNTSITPDRAIDIASIRIDDLTAASDLVGEVSGEITDIKGLEVDALAGTAFGVLLQQLQVDAGGTSALITSQGSAIADLEGNASAIYSFRAQAGGAVSFLDIIAADGSGRRPTS
ncbi:MAG: phage tail protein, partial [Pseudomonadota bacterium]|nr:phage tail protein [Pseudomonadota bacterium]